MRRGSEVGTLDKALKQQAIDVGIDIRFNTRRNQISSAGVVAEGPHRADVIATGYIFDTDMADGCYVAIANRLAPAGYSYLLIQQGRGTIATCIFQRFHEERQFLESTVDFFQQKVNLRWRSATRFGGSGNYDRVQHPVIGNRLYAGESAGYQDALFGFGLRYAVTSGFLAGAARGSSPAYLQVTHDRLKGLNTASIFNRWLYAKLGDRGRRVVLRQAVSSRDPRRLLQRIYAPAFWKTSISKWISGNPALVTTNHPNPNCECTWCRCRRRTGSSAYDDC